MYHNNQVTPEQEKELLEILRNSIDNRDIERAWEEIDKYRCPLSHTRFSFLADDIDNIVTDFIIDNDINEPPYEWSADQIFDKI